MIKKIAIIGAGGHGKVLGEIAQLNKYKIVHFYDDHDVNKKYIFPIKGTSKDLKKKFKYYDGFFVAIGDNSLRKKKYNWLKKFNLKIINLIHPKSILSKFTHLGSGICIMAGSVINPGVTLENGVIINSSASIDHDCKIEEFSHVAPNCSLAGNVIIGKNSFIGIGTSIKHQINIGKNVKVGAGSRIFKNLKKNIIFYN